jgi:hypothetical protein
VLDLLATYLFSNKQVSIPHIGTFEIKSSPAVLYFTEKEIHPPSYEVVYSSHVNLRDEQLHFLSTVTNNDVTSIHEQLIHLGDRLKNKIAKQKFEWQGVGRLNAFENEISFEPNAINQLTPVSAHKVIHQNAQHTVRRGEDQMQSGEATDQLHSSDKVKRSPFMLIVWVLIILALFFIVYHFYVNGFRVSSSGSQQRLTSWIGAVG